MHSTLIATGLALLSLTACGGPPSPAQGKATAGDATAGEAALSALRTHTSEFMARPEHDAQRVKVRHVLVMHAGAPRSTATRTREEAEQLAADLYARALAGEDFAELMAQHSDDTGGGVYTMVESGGRPPKLINRTAMVPAFGDAGWRLQPGEIGVVAEDPVRSPYGWHIVERLE